MIMMATTPPLSHAFVHAAADAWSSSRSSSAAQRPGIDRQLQSSQSGSILHEPAQAASPQIHSLASLVVDRPAQHSLKKPVLNSNCAAIVRNQCRQTPTREPYPRRPTPGIAPPSSSRIDRGTQIPIVQAAPQTFSHRGFLSLKAFGRRPPCKPLHRHGPASETLNKSGHQRPPAPEAVVWSAAKPLVPIAALN